MCFLYCYALFFTPPLQSVISSKTRGLPPPIQPRICEAFIQSIPPVVAFTPRTLQRLPFLRLPEANMELASQVKIQVQNRYQFLAVKIFFKGAPETILWKLDFTKVFLFGFFFFKIYLFSCNFLHVHSTKVLINNNPTISCPPMCKDIQ